MGNAIRRRLPIVRRAAQRAERLGEREGIRSCQAGYTLFSSAGMGMRLSRPPLVRMLALHQALAQDQGPNCSSMARRLEVSAKTIQRDIEYMRDQMGLPIEYDAAGFRYYYSRAVSSFPLVQVGEGEVLALFLAQQALQGFIGTSLEQPLRTAIAKIAAAMGDLVSVSLDDFASGVSFVHSGIASVDAAVFQAVQEAVVEQLSLCFVYRKAGGQPEELRRVQPYHLACVKGAWYLFGHDEDRAAMRTFALSRFVRIVGTGGRFERPAGFSISRHLVNSFGVFTGSGHYQVRIAFKAEVAHLISERIWHPRQQIQAGDNCDIVLSMQLSDLTEVANWVLGWGGFARVLEPDELKDRVLEMAQSVSSQYDLAQRGVCQSALSPAWPLSASESLQLSQETALLLEFALRKEDPLQLQLRFGGRG